jgi:hypothetical protein
VAEPSAAAQALSAYFGETACISGADLVKVGACLSGVLARRENIDRGRHLQKIGAASASELSR